MATKKLSKKEEKFVIEYVRTGNATQSAINAGYSERSARQTACRMLTKDYILKAIDELVKQINSEKIADAEEVMMLLTEIARGQTTEENVVVDKSGNVSIVETRVKEKERVKALELLGKRYKLYTDKVEANVDGQVEVIFTGEDNIPN